MDSLVVQFEKRLKRFTPEERRKLIKAANLSETLHHDQKRASGEPYFIHPMKVAEILVDMEMDCETVAAALLHDLLEDTEVTADDIRKGFGKQVQNLVEGVTKISILQAKSISVQRSETIRKMLLAMTKDIRVILIKLADKLHNMSTLEHHPLPKRKETAQECLDIYAPLAERLGIFWLKAELEDLSLKHLNPNVYTQITEFLESKQKERSSYLKRVENALQAEVKKEGISISVFARAKHRYSIYLKMKVRDKGLGEIYDLLGIRIICDTINECYTLLGIVHKLWPPIDGRIKDYIAMPKANGYQSLHTIVMAFGGQVIEVQLRTLEMHMRAEYGVAAHWRYKSDIKGGRMKLRDIALVTKLKSWDGMWNASEEFLKEIKREILRDSIYVFTPKGDIVELPTGSTAIDFAFHIHTEIGHRCIGAKADGSIIPLTQELRNTQAIEILTSANARPHLNWLRHVKTASARSKIRHWLNHHDTNLILDRNIIAKRTPALETEPDDKRPEPEEIKKRIIDHSKMSLKIGNERNMMIQIARCCNPSSGDQIIGYISRGRGIIVHKKLCSNLRNIHDIEQRSVDVQWEAFSPRSTQRFKISSRMTSDLFSEIEGAVRKHKGHLIEGKLDEDERGNLRGAFTLELEHKDDFKKIMKSIRTIPTVLNIQSTQ